jgi:hypothetical protein
MLTIRKEQMAAFARSAVERFEEDLAVSLRDNWPTICARLTEDRLTATIKHGVARAAFYGISSENGIFRYLNLMFLLGIDFDIDPKFEWAASILQDPSLSPSLKLDLLVRLARRHVAGDP